MSTFSNERFFESAYTNSALILLEYIINADLDFVALLFDKLGLLKFYHFNSFNSF